MPNSFICGQSGAVMQQRPARPRLLLPPSTSARSSAHKPDQEDKMQQSFVPGHGRAQQPTSKCSSGLLTCALHQSADLGCCPSETGPYDPDCFCAATSPSEESPCAGCGSAWIPFGEGLGSCCASASPCMGSKGQHLLTQAQTQGATGHWPPDALLSSPTQAAHAKTGEHHERSNADGQMLLLFVCLSVHTQQTSTSGASAWAFNTKGNKGLLRFCIRQSRGK